MLPDSFGVPFFVLLFDADGEHATVLGTENEESIVIDRGGSVLAAAFVGEFVFPENLSGREIDSAESEVIELDELADAFDRYDDG